MTLKHFELSDSESVIELFEQVFTDSENADEGKVIAGLVRNLITTTNPEELIGFVAMSDGEIIGCIFLSSVYLANNASAFILSPVAIKTTEQGKGIGQKLINFGLEHLKTKNVGLVLTYGDPNFYSKTGFQWLSEDVIQAPFKLTFPEGWLAQSLNGREIESVEGRSKCVPALSQQHYW